MSYYLRHPAQIRKTTYHRNSLSLHIEDVLFCCCLNESRLYVTVKLHIISLSSHA